MKKVLSVLLLAFLLTGCSFFGGIDSALNSKNYENVEVNTVLTVKEGASTNVVETIMYIDGNNIYSHADVGGIDLYTYVTIIDDVIYMANKTEASVYKKDWEVIPMISEEDLEHYEEQSKAIPDFKKEDFDKDEDGYYVLKSEKAQEYLDSVFGDFKQYMKGASFDDLVLKFKIEKNRITIIDFSVDFYIGSNKSSITCEMTYSNFGKAKVEIPKEVQDKFDEEANKTKT
ncbi:MAG: lipoprotein [Bacilli bacterium]